MDVASKATDGTLLWDCPGCETFHGVPVDPDPERARGRPVWGFNGSLTAPTLTPSVLVRWPQDDGTERVCHCFMRDGRIEFLSDCTHALAGKTVAMTEYR